jgi:hypothetical protein
MVAEQAQVAGDRLAQPDARPRAGIDQLEAHRENAGEMTRGMAEVEDPV